MAIASSGRHFVCQHCGRLAFLEPVAADGIQLIGIAKDGLNCPTCATTLTHALLHGESVEICQGCRGLLLRRHAFAELVHTLRVSAPAAARIPPPFDRTALERVRGCPRCGKAFETYPYGGPGNAVIDGCARCDVIWLDHGELRQITDAPGRDRGRS